MREDFWAAFTRLDSTHAEDEDAIEALEKEAAKQLGINKEDVRVILNEGDFRNIRAVSNMRAFLSAQIASTPPSPPVVMRGFDQRYWGMA